MIKKTTQENPNKIISAYKDNVAFAEGPVVAQFAPADHSKPDFFQVKDIKSVISLKAETHNFPTTVEPFNLSLIHISKLSFASASQNCHPVACNRQLLLQT